MSMKIVYHRDIEKKLMTATEEAQKTVDAAVLRYIDPYVPYDTGALTDSGIKNTKIGSGKVVYKTPYARRVYYGLKEDGKFFDYNKDIHPLAGRLWFNRMKADHLDDIKREAGLK